MGIIRDIGAEFGLLEYTKEEDAVLRYAAFIEAKFRAAAEIFAKFVDKKPHPMTFRACLFQVWKENDGTKKFWVADPYLVQNFPELCGKEHKIEISEMVSYDPSQTASTYHDTGGKYLGMYICTGLLDQAGNLEELERNLHKLLLTVYHECDHIYHQGGYGEWDPNDFDERIGYYMDEAEIRAFSKSLALIYFKAFPGSKFDYEKLRQYLIANYTENNLHYQVGVRYMDMFRDPKNFKTENPDNRKGVDRILSSGQPVTVQQLYEAFEKYMKYIASFVEFFNKQQVD